MQKKLFFTKIKPFIIYALGYGLLKWVLDHLLWDCLKQYLYTSWHIEEAAMISKASSYIITAIIVGFICWLYIKHAKLKMKKESPKLSIPNNTPITYGKDVFIRLCNVNDIDNWDDNFKIKDDGVYKELKKDIGVYATKEELATLNYHHLNDLSKRCLDFPFTLEDFNQFIENYGLTGCVDQYYLESLKANKQNTLDKKSLIRDARALVACITKVNNSDYYFEQEIIKSETFINLRSYLSEDFRAKLSNSTILGHQLRQSLSVIVAMPSLASEFLDELERLEKEWNLIV